MTSTPTHATFVNTEVTTARSITCWERRYPQPTTPYYDVHQSFEIGVLMAGGVERYLEGTAISQSPGAVWLHSAWEPHAWRVSAPDSRLMAVFFLPGFLGDLPGFLPDWLDLFAASPRARPQIASAAGRERVIAVASEIEQELKEEKEGWEISVRLLLLRLLHMLGRNWKARRSASGQPSARLSDLERVMPAIRMLGQGPVHHVTLERAAAACTLSVSQFRAIFRRTVGLTYGRFGLRARLAHVAGRLLTSDATLRKLAEEADFSDASHLHHAFVTAYGCTPSEYRRHGLRRSG